MTTRLLGAETQSAGKRLITKDGLHIAHLLNAYNHLVKNHPRG